ncbi:MAG TPA: hypothetical protein VN043_07325 [Rhodanobacter sp.]|nr:hypothetical protein [Rhodanobacter sp.]
MPIHLFRSSSGTHLGRLLNAFQALRSRGFLLDGPAHWTPARPAEPRMAAAPPASSATLAASDLALFVTRSRELLSATDEPSRRQLENEVLSLSIPLHAAGTFEVLRIANPVLATMVRDHLAEAQCL